MKKFYITNSIPYLNAPPHIGHALEFVETDVIARFYRQKGEEVFYLNGTDEHGTKISRSAAAAGKTPQQFVDELASVFYGLKDALNLSFDNFIRTSDRERHWPVAQELWKKIEAAGDLYKKSYEGLYCVGHEAFVTAKDLQDGVCAVHKKAPEKIVEENWFFRLSRHGEEIAAAIERDELRIVPESRKNEMLNFIKEGLTDTSFSRPKANLDWGIPVPGDDTQVMYVWADALSNYISGYGDGSVGRRMDRWMEHPADAHVIGKDILRFHAVIWPAMLMAAGLPLPKSIFVHGFVTVNGEKMSKSIGNVVDPFEFVKKYGADAVRYYLLREIPAGEDGDFSEEKFKERYNGDLANGLGNVVARVAALGEKLGDIEITKSDAHLFDFKKQERPDLETWFAEFKFDKLLIGIFDAVHNLDRTIAREEPWANKNQEELKNQIIRYAAHILFIADALVPFLPETAEKIKRQFHFNDAATPAILRIKKTAGLFPRI